MLVRIGVDVPCAAVDAHDLSFTDESVGTLVCVNAMLFADEVRRVLKRGGSLVWVNTIGEITPIHLSADAVAAALGDGFELVASPRRVGNLGRGPASGRIAVGPSRLPRPPLAAYPRPPWSSSDVPTTSGAS